MRTLIEQQDSVSSVIN